MAAVDFTWEEWHDFAEEHDVSPVDTERVWEEMHSVTSYRALSVLMERANNLLGAHGVESMGGPPNPQVLYLNMGDTYVGTLLLDQATTTFHLTTWGDFLEGWEQQNLPAIIEEAWVEYGADEFLRTLVKLEPELEEVIDDTPVVVDILGQFRMAIDSASVHGEQGPTLEDDHIYFGLYPRALKRVSADPDALYVAWGLAEIAASDGMAEPRESHHRKAAQECLKVLFREVNERFQPSMPAFFYMLMLFHPSAARYLGRIKGSDKFVQAWMEHSLPDPEFSYMELEDPNYLDYAIALADALRPAQHVDRSVFTTEQAMPDDARYRVLGDLIEDQRYDDAVKFLKTKSNVLPRERKHGLEGA